MLRMDLLMQRNGNTSEQKSVTHHCQKADRRSHSACQTCCHRHQPSRLHPWVGATLKYTCKHAFGWLLPIWASAQFNQTSFQAKTGTWERRHAVAFKLDKHPAADSAFLSGDESTYGEFETLSTLITNNALHFISIFKGGIVSLPLNT